MVLNTKDKTSYKQMEKKDYINTHLIRPRIISTKHLTITQSCASTDKKDTQTECWPLQVPVDPVSLGINLFCCWAIRRSRKVQGKHQSGEWHIWEEAAGWDSDY